ncbi:MAG: extracellular solute-binding protein [Singulisphaera sp.]
MPKAEVFQKFIDASTENADVGSSKSHRVDQASKLVSALTAGNPPDVMLSLPALTMTLQSRGDIVPVDDIVESVNTKYKLVESQLTPFKYQDATWGVPMWGMTFLLHYRTDLLEGSGVGAPPTTWGEWLGASTKMTGGGKFGIVLPANKNLFTTENFYSLMINANARVYGPDGEVAFSSPETVDALPSTRTWSRPRPRRHQPRLGHVGAGAAARHRRVHQRLLVLAAGHGRHRPQGRLGRGRPASQGGRQAGPDPLPEQLHGLQAGGGQEGGHRPLHRVHAPARGERRVAGHDGADPLLRIEAAQKADSFWTHLVIAAHRPMVEKQLEVLPARPAVRV